MGALRFADLRMRPTEVLDLTSLTVNEFGQLVPPFEAAFQAHMARWRLDGQPRTARRYTTYTNCPLPTPEDRLLFILVYREHSRFFRIHRPAPMGGVRGEKIPNTVNLGRTGPWPLRRSFRSMNSATDRGVPGFGSSCTTASISGWIRWRPM